MPETCKWCLLDIRKEKGRWILAWWRIDDDGDPADCGGHGHQPMTGGWAGEASA